MARRLKVRGTAAEGIQEANRRRRAYGYVRVSSELQTEGQSLDVQREKITGICLANGWELAGIITEEPISGSVPFRSRPEGRKLWELLEQGDVIVALRLDRAFRNTSDALDVLQACKQRKLGLVVADLNMQDCTVGAVAEMVFTMLAAVAGFERARLRERLSEGRAAKLAKGGALGGAAPFGFIKQGAGKEAVLKPDAALQEYVLELSSKGYPSRAIVNFLRRDWGISTTPNSVCKFLRVAEQAQRSSPRKGLRRAGA